MSQQLIEEQLIRAYFLGELPALRLTRQTLPVRLLIEGGAALVLAGLVLFILYRMAADECARATGHRLLDLFGQSVT